MRCRCRAEAQPQRGLDIPVRPAGGEGIRCSLSARRVTDGGSARAASTTSRVPLTLALQTEAAAADTARLGVVGRLVLPGPADCSARGGLDDGRGFLHPDHRLPLSQPPRRAKTGWRWGAPCSVDACRGAARRLPVVKKSPPPRCPSELGSGACGGGANWWSRGPGTAKFLLRQRIRAWTTPGPPTEPHQPRSSWLRGAIGPVHHRVEGSGDI